MAEPIVIKLGMYVMSPELTSTAYFVKSSHQSVCLHAYPVIVTRQRLSEKVTPPTNTHGVTVFERVVFCVVSVV
jgi:hypothetical protein